MIVQEKSLNKIIKNSTNITKYSLNYYGCYRDRPIYPDNIAKIINKLHSISRTLSYETNWYTDESKEEINNVVKGLGDIFFEHDSDSDDFITIIFSEDFGVEFDFDEEHLLYGDPTIKLTLNTFVIKDGKTLEDIEDHINVLEKLFKL